MKLKHKLIQTGFALALTLPLFTTFTPVSRAAEAMPGASLQLRGAPLTELSLYQADPASVRPTPGVVSPQSVGAGAASTGAQPSSGTQSSSGAQPSPGAQPSSGGQATPTPTGSGTVAPAGTFQAETAPDGKQARAGSLIVTFRPSADASARSAAHHQVSSQAVEQVGKSNSSVRVQVAPGTLAQAMAAYAARSDVQRVEPDYLVHADMTPNDPRYADEWGPGKIQAPTAWDVVGGGAGVRVAVLDTGVANHPDLAGRVYAVADFTGSPYGAADRHGHGTHVAGTVAAVANNSVGVVGVAWNANLLIGKVLGDGGSGSLTSVANGMVWAADNGAKVISMSLGANLDCSGTIQDAADYAWSKGAVIVAAAGNDGANDVHTPANCNHIIPIGAVDQTDSRASFSNYGSGVPIAAPGVMIVSTSKDGDYLWMSGTSMATPHAAGVAALIWASAYGTGNQAVVSRLLSTADAVAGTGSHWVYGRVNAARAVAGGGQAPPPPPPPSPSPSPTPSPTPSPSPTPPVNCSPRPRVGVQTTPIGAGTLRVTVSVNPATSGTNRLQEVRFGASANAVIDVGTRAEAGNFTVSVPSGTSSYTFTVRRTANGQAVTVPLVVVDSCGQWKTFVGGGAGAF